jgi:uncharacterized protein (DUF1778 family)
MRYTEQVDQRLLTFTFRLNRAEQKALKRAAKIAKCSVAEFVRSWAVSHARQLVAFNGLASGVQADVTLATAAGETSRPECKEGTVSAAPSPD